MDVILGFNYATAFEWALKLKELSYIIAEPYSSADFSHGPIALVERGYPVMAVAPRGKVFDSMQQMLKRLHDDILAELVVISNNKKVLSLGLDTIDADSLDHLVPDAVDPDNVV